MGSPGLGLVLRGRIGHEVSWPRHPMVKPSSTWFDGYGRTLFVLMDIGIPGMEGIEATRIICAECPEVRVIGLSMFQEGEAAESMRQAGAEPE